MYKQPFQIPEDHLSSLHSENEEVANAFMFRARRNQTDVNIVLQQGGKRLASISYEEEWYGICPS